MSNSGQKSGKAPERANFVNLLSQYLKEKRHLGDISVGMASKPETKVAGLETISMPNLVASTSNVKSSDFCPGIGSFGRSTSQENTTNNTDFRKAAAIVEPKDGQLTLFFGGQVLLYNSFPADKVKEIMALANQVCSTASCNGVVAADHFMEKVNSDIHKIDDSNHSDIPDLNIASTTIANSPAQDLPADRSQHGGSDLRIARRNSLHKFFAKRKDRAAARAPYQVNNLRGGSPPPLKPDESKSSSNHDEEGQSSKEASRDLDLKL